MRSFLQQQQLGNNVWKIPYDSTIFYDGLKYVLHLTDFVEMYNISAISR